MPILWILKDRNILQYTYVKFWTIKLSTDEIYETSGSVIWSLDDKYIFYSKLDESS